MNDKLTLLVLKHIETTTKPYKFKIIFCSQPFLKKKRRDIYIYICTVSVIILCGNNDIIVYKV